MTTKKFHCLNCDEGLTATLIERGPAVKGEAIYKAIQKKDRSIFKLFKGRTLEIVCEKCHNPRIKDADLEDLESFLHANNGEFHIAIKQT